MTIHSNGTTDQQPVRVLGIGGSTRRGSTSRALLRTALDLVEEAGGHTVLADVREMDLPIFDDDLPLEAYPSRMDEFFAEARAADAYIFCSPTYHGTVSGAVKNALDHLNVLGDDVPPYLGGKPVGLMAVGGGGAANVLTSLHHAARAMNGLTIPTTVISSGSAIRDGEVSDEAVQRRLRAMVGELLDLAVRLRRPVAGEASVLR